MSLLLHSTQWKHSLWNIFPTASMVAPDKGKSHFIHLGACEFRAELPLITGNSEDMGGGTDVVRFDAGADAELGC